MKETSIKTILNSFWASKIDKLVFDLCTMTISISITTIKNGIKNTHNVVFEDVNAFFFVNSKKTAKRSLIPWQNMELSEIHHFQKGDDFIQHTQKKKKTSQYSANPNFLLEIWSDALFIEADSITIDGTHYELD